MARNAYFRAMLRLYSNIKFAIASVALMLGTLSAVNGQFTTVGSATSLGNNCFQIVPGNTAVKGAIWNNNQINLTNGFDITFHVTIFATSGIGFSADGIAFVLQNTGTAATSANPGNTLGYANTTTGPPCPGGPHAGGITPSLAVELDIFDNNQANTCINELADDHIAIVRNGNFTAPVFGPVCASPVCATNVEVPVGSTTGCRTFRIVYTPSASNQLQVYYNGNLRVNTNYNIIANVFGGNPNVYFGITGSNGGLTAQPIICWEFANAGSDSTICAGSPLQMSASGGNTYSWTPNTWVSSATSATPNFTQGSTPGTYPLTVSVTNTYGCTDTDQATVTVEANPTVNAGADQSICLGDSVQIGPAPNANYTYLWSPATGLSSTTVARPFADPTLTTTYTLTVTDTSTVRNCTATDQVTVTVNPNPTAVAGPNVTICDGDTATLGGASVPGLIYSWTPNTNLTSNTVSNPGAFPTSNTTYQVVVTNSTTGCDDTASVDVTVNPLPFADAGNDTSICLGLSVTLQGDSTGGDIISWTPAGTLSSGTVINPVATPGATTTYTFTVTNSITNCSSSDQVTVTINIPDFVDITSADTFICNVDTVNITANSGPTIDVWNWTPPTGLADPTNPNTQAFPTTSTTYYLTGTDTATGCSAIDSITIDVFELNLSGLADDSICMGDTITLNVIPSQGSGNYSFTWIGIPTGYISDTTIGNPDVAPTVTTQYIVQVTDLTSTCSDQALVTVVVSQLLASVSPITTEINPGQWVQLNASDGDFWSWDPATGLNVTDRQNVIASPTTTTTYTVTVSDSTGCSGTATATVIVDSMINQNVFTPNGDGINDVVDLRYLGVGEYEVFIYDRWGALIFTTGNPEMGWDGKNSKGEDVPEGVYYILVTLPDDDAIPDTHKNAAWSLTLLR